MTAAEMLGALADELERAGVQLVIAGDVGRVRDVLRRAGDSDTSQRSQPTIAAALDVLKAGS